MRRRIEAIFAIFLVSGIGGLIYESVWTHYVKLFLGHAAYAQTLVLVVFIGGLALGSWLCSRVAQRIRNPFRVYAAVEGAIGLMALAFHQVFQLATEWGYAYLLPAACDPASTFCAAQWLLAAAMLAPQSILLGATFPLVSSAVLRESSEHAGHDISTLYFLNSLGAVLGVLASAFVLIPGVGLPGTLMVAGLANIGVAITAWFVSRHEPPPLVAVRLPAQAGAPAATPAQASLADRRLLVILLATAFLTGLSSFIYEIAWIRMLSLVFGASTHSFEIMLASFILGLALGGYWVRNRIDASGDPVRLLAIIQIVMGLAAAATVAIYNGAFDLMAWLLWSLARTDGGYFFFNLASTGIALLVMLPTTFCAGMTLPIITYRLLRSPAGERSLGLVYSVNTLGAILGVIIAVHLLLRSIGLGPTVLTGAAIDVLLGAGLLVLYRAPAARSRIPWAAVAGLALFVVFAATFQIDPKRSASGVYRSGVATLGRADTILFNRDGKTATVDVMTGGGSVRSIRTNGKPDAALAMDPQAWPTDDEYTMTLLSVLPLAHNPGARTAAVIGFGSGMSTATILGSPNIERVDTIEIEPAMVEGAALFRPLVEKAFTDPRSRIVIDDAKSYFARGRERFDIIVSEPSNPWVSGVASLFTREFYHRMSTYMNDGAVLAQWLHTYEIDTATLASIFRAIEATFPDFVIYATNDADLVVIARKGGRPLEFDPVVMGWPGLAPFLGKTRLAEADSIRRRSFGHWRGLAPIYSSHAVAANSDFFPVVDQRASKTRYLHVRADELTGLLRSSMPILEMLAGSTMATERRNDGLAVAVIDRAAASAWQVHDLALSAGSMPRAFDSREEFAGFMARHWAQCESGLAFPQALPLLVSVAEAVNPFIPPAAASALWAKVAASPCGRKLAAGERRWLDLFSAVGRRDAGAMASVGSDLLAGLTNEPAGAVTEYALLAAVLGNVCQGDTARAHALLQEGLGKWVRRGSRVQETLYLDALSQPGRRGPPPACAAR